MADSHRASISGLVELAEEVAGGPAGQRLPVAFRLPNQERDAVFWFSVSIEMVQDPGSDHRVRALVIAPSIT